MKKEKSCGAVIYRENDGIEILLLKHKNGGHWAFPKGHVEKKETEEETALREIREETGLKVKLDTGFRQAVSYSPKPGVWKDVVYFAAKCEQSKTTPQEEEVLELRWESPGLALGTVTYENDRKLLQAFLEYWEKKPKG